MQLAREINLDSDERISETISGVQPSSTKETSSASRQPRKKELD
jgi:hypothetical protein